MTRPDSSGKWPTASGSSSSVGSRHAATPVCCALAGHPSCLGWLSSGGAALLDGPPRVLHAVETRGAAPPGASFVALPATELPTTPSRTETPRPMLLLDVDPARSDVLLGRGAEVIGVVER